MRTSGGRSTLESKAASNSNSRPPSPTDSFGAALSLTDALNMELGDTDEDVSLSPRSKGSKSLRSMGKRLVGKQKKRGSIGNIGFLVEYVLVGQAVVDGALGLMTRITGITCQRPIACRAPVSDETLYQSLCLLMLA